MTFSTPNPPMTLPALSKLRVRREAWIGAGISVRKADSGAAFRRQCPTWLASAVRLPNLRSSPAVQVKRVALPKERSMAAEIERADNVAWSESRHVFLISIHIHHGVGRDGVVFPEAKMLTPAGV